MRRSNENFKGTNTIIYIINPINNEIDMARHTKKTSRRNIQSVPIAFNF